jgi:hypothetical protein
MFRFDTVPSAGGGLPPEPGPGEIFRESTGLIREALAREYRLNAEATARLERELEEWFERFCRRPGAPPPVESRETLLMMACIYARSHARFLVETGTIPYDERLERRLRRDPVEIAREISRPLRLLYRRIHPA